MGKGGQSKGKGSVLTNRSQKIESEFENKEIGEGYQLVNLDDNELLR